MWGVQVSKGGVYTDDEGMGGGFRRALLKWRGEF